MSAIVGIDNVIAPVGREVLASVDARTLELVHGRRSRDILRRGWLVRRALLLADVLGLTAAFFLAAALFGPDSARRPRLERRRRSCSSSARCRCSIVLAKIYGLYERDEERTDHSTRRRRRRRLPPRRPCSSGSSTSSRARRAWPSRRSRRLVAFWGLSVLIVTGGRAVARATVRRSVAYLQNTIIVGAGDVGQLTARKLLAHPGVRDQPRRLRRLACRRSAATTSRT